MSAAKHKDGEPQPAEFRNLARVALLAAILQGPHFDQTTKTPQTWNLQTFQEKDTVTRALKVRLVVDKKWTNKFFIPGFPRTPFYTILLTLTLLFYVNRGFGGTPQIWILDLGSDRGVRGIISPMDFRLTILTLTQNMSQTKK